MYVCVCVLVVYRMARFGCSEFKSATLWWPNYDGKPDIHADWEDFGGWTTAAIKQFDGTTSKCSAGVDLNYMP